MGVKNVPYCAPGGGNTGVNKLCYNDIGRIVGVIFVKPGKIYPTSSIAALKAAIEADILNDDPLARAYPLQDIVEIADNSKASNELTFSGNGQTVITGDNFYSHRYRWNTGGFCLNYVMRKSRGTTRAFFQIDDRGQLIGTDAGTVSVPEQMKGLTGYNYTEPFKYQTSNTTAADYGTRLDFAPEQVNDYPAIIDFDNENGGGLGYLTGLNGLFNVATLQGAARAANVLVVKEVVVGCGSTDLFDLYAANLAVVGAWRARNTVTKNPIAITSVAQSAGNRGWTVTLNAADANYTATAGGVEIALVGPTELQAIILTTDGTGYDSAFNSF
jgi:hypothetical protein